MGWQTYVPDPAEATALLQAVNELARALRHWDFDGDGCIDDGRQPLRLGGAAIITSGSTTAQQDAYRYGCARLGVDARDGGWALWHSWDDKARAHTLVTTALDTIRALRGNWSHGRDVHRVQPRRARIAAVVPDWVGPITLSPSPAATVGLGGR